MTKRDLAQKVAVKLEVSTTKAEAIIKDIEDIILSEVSDNVPFLGGKFKIKDVSAKDAKKGRNPNTGEIIQIAAKPASKKLVFKVGKGMKETVSKM